MKTLREILKERGIGQKIVADALGIHVNVIARYDDLSKRSLDEVLKISESTGIPLEELIGVKIGRVTDVSKNTGSVNTGNVGGHNVTIADAAVKKIIRENEIEVERDLSVENYLQIIKRLEARISDLERIIEAKNDLISVLKKNDN